MPLPMLDSPGTSHCLPYWCVLRERVVLLSLLSCGQSPSCGCLLSWELTWGFLLRKGRSLTLSVHGTPSVHLLFERLSFLYCSYGFWLFVCFVSRPAVPWENLFF